MARFRNKKLSRWMCALFILAITFSLIVFTLCMDTLPILVDENTQTRSIISAKNPGTASKSCGQDEVFTYIPLSTVRKWAQTEFLIVFGVMSVDIDERQHRRNLQRATCWTFPGVATKANDYSGSILPLYTLARHPAHGFKYSKSLILEAEHWHDLLTFPLDEGRVTTDKKIGGDGYWGREAGIGMGRKTFFWLEFALRAFPRTIYVGKGDDDMFMHVPQYLADLRLLPQRGTYWGPYAGGMVLKNKEMELVDVNFMVGYCVAIARDTTEVVVSYGPLRRIVALPYTKERELDFRLLTVDRDDIMIGRILKETGYPAIFVAEQLGCRFHNTGKGESSRNFSLHSVVAHHIKEHEYHLYMSYFTEKSIDIQNTIIKKLSPTLYWVNCPIK